MSPENDSHHVAQSGMEERSYLLRRAEDHRLLARQCDNPSSRLIHQSLQQLYEQRAAAVAMVDPD